MLNLWKIKGEMRQHVQQHTLTATETEEFAFCSDCNTPNVFFPKTTKYVFHVLGLSAVFT